MAVKKRGLGRGLDALIPSTNSSKDNKEKEDKNISKESESKMETKNPDNVEDILEIEIHKIEPNKSQPRKVFDEDTIEELADSIKQFGVLQPLIVQKKGNYYEIVAGERRWRASKMAGLKKVPVIVREYDEKERVKISLIENIQRENLNPIEEAQAYEQLKKEYGLKQDEIANSVSKSRAAVTNTMRLLKLDDRVQKMILENLISSGHGRALLVLEDKDRQYEVALQILDENINVRDTEKLVKKILKQKDMPPVQKKEEKKDEMVYFFENKMKDIIGSKVSIIEKKNHKGKIEIEYYSKEELERIIDLIQSIEK